MTNTENTPTEADHAEWCGYRRYAVACTCVQEDRDDYGYTPVSTYWS